MKYDEFLTKLRQTVADFKKARGKEPTVPELVAFTEGKVIRPRTRGLKSVRGMFIGLLMLFPKHDMDNLLSYPYGDRSSIYRSYSIDYVETMESTYIQHSF